MKKIMIIKMASNTINSISQKEYNHLVLAAKTLFNLLLKTRKIMDKTGNPNYYNLCSNLLYYIIKDNSINRKDLFHFDSVLTGDAKSVIENLHRLRFKTNWSAGYLIRMKYILVWANSFFFKEYDALAELYYDDIYDILVDEFNDPGMIIFDYIYKEQNFEYKSKDENVVITRTIHNEAINRDIISNMVDKVMKNIPENGKILDSNIINFYTCFNETYLHKFICHAVIFANIENDPIFLNFAKANKNMWKEIMKNIK